MARLPPSCSNWSRTCQSGMSTWCHLPGLSPAEENCHMRPFPAYSVGGWFALSEYQSWIAPWVHSVRPSLLLYLHIIPSPAGCAGGCSLLSTSQSGIILCFHAFLPFTVSPQLDGSSFACLILFARPPCFTLHHFTILYLHLSQVSLSLLARKTSVHCRVQLETRHGATNRNGFNLTLSQFTTSHIQTKNLDHINPGPAGNSGAFFDCHSGILRCCQYPSWSVSVKWSVFN